MSEEKISIYRADREVFRSAFDDGLVDILLSSFVLMWAVAPWLSESIGDFWSSAIFLPVWGLVLIAVALIRKYWIKPRAGVVKFGVARKKKLTAFSWIMLILNVLFLVLGMLAFLTPVVSPWTRMLPLAVMVLISSSLAGYFLDVPRFFVYGLLFAGGFFLGEWLYQNFGFAHHGYPVVFGSLTVVIFLVGIYKLITFIKENPLPSEEQLQWEVKNG
jgi:hypothetical protein